MTSVFLRRDVNTRSRRGRPHPQQRPQETLTHALTLDFSLPDVRSGFVLLKPPAQTDNRIHLLGLRHELLLHCWKLSK